MKVVTVETVVLPNMWADGEEGTQDVDLHTGGKLPSRWYQFVRVWYDEA